MTIMSKIWQYRYNKKALRDADDFVKIGRDDIDLKQCQNFFAKFARQISLSREDVVLDLACGNGIFTQLFADKAKAVIAVDVSANQVNEAEKRLAGSSVEFYVGDFFCIPKTKLQNVTVLSLMGAAHYFPNRKYLEKILEELVTHAPKLRCIFVSEVCHPDWIGRHRLQESKGLNKVYRWLVNNLYTRWIYTYYHPEFFERFAHTHGWQARQLSEDIAQISYRYNMLMVKGASV